jgi:hypothetical protein
VTRWATDQVAAKVLQLPQDLRAAVQPHSNTGRCAGTGTLARPGRSSLNPPPASTAWAPIRLWKCRVLITVGMFVYVYFAVQDTLGITGPRSAARLGQPSGPLYSAGIPPEVGRQWRCSGPCALPWEVAVALPFTLPSAPAAATPSAASLRSTRLATGFAPGVGLALPKLRPAAK